jgi:hypothetical protein
MICYHGTIKKHFKKIQKDGLREYSYLSPFLSSALCMGGPYIVGIDIPEVTDEWIGRGNWEYRNISVIYPQNFLITMKFSNRVLFFNTDLQRKLDRERIISENKNYCNFCLGKGELTYIENGHHWKVGGSRFDYKKSRKGKLTICPKCNGFGYT